MDVDTTVDLTREAMTLTLMVGAPVLVVGMVIGLLIGLLQALTQIQDQTVAFVPKILAMALALGLALPWILQKMMLYSEHLISTIPDRL